MKTPMLEFRSTTISICIITVWCMPLGCTTPAVEPNTSVAQAWGDRDQLRNNTETKYEPIRHSLSVGSTGTRNTGHDNVIASVNGQSIPKSKLVDVIVRSYGLNVLDHLIGLQAAKDHAQKIGLSIDAKDVDFEFELALHRLTNPLSAVTPRMLDRKAAELILDSVLVQRNMSRDELMIILRRNAYLRKMVRSKQQFTQQQIQEEYNNAYGARVEVRHIQLATLANVTRVKDQLREGVSFAELAAKYSANQASARDGGLLEPFSQSDDRLPDLFRATAFSLLVGEVSDAIRIGEWVHLIRLEKSIPVEDRNIQEVHAELEKRLRDRLTEPAMFNLFENLYKGANIEIYDPALREAFEKRHSFSAQTRTQAQLNTDE